MKYFFLFSILVIIGIAGRDLFVFLDSPFSADSPRMGMFPSEEDSFVSSQVTHLPTGTIREEMGEDETIHPGGDVRSGTILFDVPFISQAPSGNWGDARLQNGCEEAAILMAAVWGKGVAIDPGRAEGEIFALAKFQEEKIGHFLDTSARDTAQLMEEYFDYSGVRVQNGISPDSIRSELERGNLVIVPVNGKRLGNLFYTPPGPPTHMLVIRGYDYDTNEFITNDPGTRRGELFRYKEKVIHGALQDYPTGYHETQEPGKTAMIVAEKEIDISP